jgi:hypothetical protein
MTSKKQKRQKKKHNRLKQKESKTENYEKFMNIILKLVNNDYPEMSLSTRVLVTSRTASLLYKKHDVEEYESMVIIAMHELCKDTISKVLLNPENAIKMKKIFIELSDGLKKDINAKDEIVYKNEESVDDLSERFLFCRVSLSKFG